MGNPQHKPVRCCDCAYNHPELCGYVELRDKNYHGTLPETATHSCRSFSSALVSKPPRNKT